MATPDKEKSTPKRSLEIEDRGVVKAAKTKSSSVEVGSGRDGSGVAAPNVAVSRQEDTVEIDLAYVGTGTMSLFRSGKRRAVTGEEFVFRLPSRSNDMPSLSFDRESVNCMAPLSGCSVGFEIPSGWVIAGDEISVHKETLRPDSGEVVWRFSMRMQRTSNPVLRFVNL